MNNITLYQAASTVRDLLEQIDPETGELPEGFEQACELVASKAQACTAYILENDAHAVMVEAHAQTLLDRAKTARRRSDRLREYLAAHMTACGIQSIKGDDGTFCATLALGRDESIDIFDAAQLPKDYLREVPAKYEADKTLIKKAIKDGFEVPGARLIAKDRLTLK
jgi:hypothetical protein